MSSDLETSFFDHCDTQDWSQPLTQDEIDELSPMTISNILAYFKYVYDRDHNDPKVDQLRVYCMPLLDRLNQYFNENGEEVEDDDELPDLICIDCEKVNCEC